jgi:hypothetical protein
MVRSSHGAIDIDDGRTWPVSVREMVKIIAQRCPPEIQYLDEIDAQAQENDSFSRLLDGRYLRAYHCTKLLPHELVAIHETGLQPLSSDLVATRLRLAVAGGYLTAQEYNRLKQQDVFTLHDESGRADVTCFLFGKATFDLHWRGLWRLLTLWGGEAIYWSNGDPEDELYETVDSIGTPTVLVLNILVSNSSREPVIHSNLLGHFVARYLELDYSGEGRTHLPIPPGQIIGTWQPGDSAFERFRGLRNAISRQN